MDSVLKIIVLFIIILLTLATLPIILLTLINSGVYSHVISDTGKNAEQSDYFGKESIAKCI